MSAAPKSRAPLENAAACALLTTTQALAGGAEPDLRHMAEHLAAGLEATECATRPGMAALLRRARRVLAEHKAAG